jgi:hypothetical protein
VTAGGSARARVHVGEETAGPTPLSVYDANVKRPRGPIATALVLLLAVVLVAEAWLVAIGEIKVSSVVFAAALSIASFAAVWWWDRRRRDER